MNDWAATRKAWAVIEKARIDQLLEVMDALKVPYLYSEEYLKCRVIIANMYETGRRTQDFKEKLVDLGLSQTVCGYASMDHFQFCFFRNCIKMKESN